jgi:hypothetical protein
LIFNILFGKDRAMKSFRRGLQTASAILIILTALAGYCTAGQNPVKIAKTDQGFVVTEGSDKVMVYQRKHTSRDGKYKRANYIHPLYGLDGQVLTEDFPRDHLHHRGVFWAWHQLWLSDMKIGDPWATVDSFWDVYDAKILTPDSKSRALQPSRSTAPKTTCAR